MWAVPPMVLMPPHPQDALSYMHASGDWTGAATVMQAFVNDNEALLLFTEALEALPAPQAAQASVSGCIDVVLMALRAHHFDRALQGSGCRALTTLIAATSPFGALRAAAGGGVSSALYVARTYASDAVVVEAALDLLAAVVAGAGPTAQSEATLAGAIADAVAALHTHSTAPGVARAACTALAHTVHPGMQASQVAAGVSGAVGAALRAMRTHPAAEEAAAWAVANMVEDMVEGLPDNCGRASFLKAHEAAAALLQSPAPATAAQAARLLAVLLEGTSNASDVAGGEVAQQLVGAMRAHPREFSVQVYCCRALSCLTRQPDGRQAALRAGAVLAIATALQLHANAFDSQTLWVFRMLQTVLCNEQRRAEAQRPDDNAAPDEAVESAGEAGVLRFGFDGLELPAAAEPPAVAVDGPVAQPLALPVDDAAIRFGSFAAVQAQPLDAAAAASFGSFDPAQADEGAPAPADPPSAAAGAASPQGTAAPGSMVELLDNLMPWLRLDAAAPPSPEQPPAQASPLAQASPPVAAPGSPEQPAPAPPAAAAASPASPASTKPAARSAADEERETCVICLHDRVCVALLPCRHFPMCASAECAAMLGSPPLCPMCRVGVEQRVTVAPSPRAPPPGGNAWKRGPPPGFTPPPQMACAGGCGAPPCMLFLPCRHLALCADAACAGKAVKAAGGAADAKLAHCPACRARASAVVPLFTL